MARQVLSFARRLVLVAVATLVVVGLAEVGLRLGLALLEGRGSSAAAGAERQLFLDSLPIIESPAGESETTTASKRPWFDRQELHPFFGFVMDRSLKYVNNQGFPTRDTYPYRCRRDEYVVGIFGASVAQSVGGRPETISEVLLPALAGRGYTAVTVLQLAIGASKQPAAFNVFCTYLPDIDMAIFLDGLNEAVEARAKLRDYPVIYPKRQIYAPLAAPAASPYVTRDTALLSLFTEQITATTQRLQRSPLRFSLIAHLVWRIRAGRYNQLAAELRASIDEQSSKGWLGFDPISRDGADEVVDRYFRFYEDLTGYADMIARSQGKLFFHFVQPNQYVTGGKRLSREELALYVTKPVGVYDEYYQELDAMCARLRARGVESHSLSMVFADVEETLYRDACCHFNERGDELLERAMAAEIIASGALAEVPAVADRKLPDWRLAPAAAAGS